MKKKKCFKCGYWNNWDALYCGLCYEPFNKAAAEKPAAPGAPAVPPERPGKQPRPRLLALVLAGLTLAVIAAFRLLSPTFQDAPAPAAGVNRFQVKTAAADKLLEDYTAAKEALLAKMGAKPDPEGFGIAGEYTAELFRIEEEYAAAMEALRLPGPGGLDPAADAGYLLWLETHRYKENTGLEDFSRRYRLLAEKAGAGG